MTSPVSLMGAATGCLVETALWPWSFSLEVLRGRVSPRCKGHPKYSWITWIDWLCSRSFCPKLEIQHDKKRKRSMPTLTGEEWLSRENVIVLCWYQKGKYELKIRCESDLLPTSKEYVYCAGFCTIPYIRAYIWSWHTWLAQKETTSCTRFLYRIGVGLDTILNSNPCDLISLHWFLWWYLCLFKISYRAEGVTSLHRSVTATSELTSAGCHLTRLASDPGWAG